MNPSEQNPDPLDELLAAQPIKPSADFAARTLVRLLAEEAVELGVGHMEDDLDELLAAQPIQASADFADRVMAQLDAKQELAMPQDEKVVGFPSWVVALGSIAALMVLGMFSFITLFNYADQQKSGQSTMVNNAVPLAGDRASWPADLPVDASPVEYYVTAEDSPSGALPDVLEYETILTLDETLDDALLLADLETLNTLQAFLN